MVDLERLDALHAKEPSGRWIYTVSKNGRPQVSAVGGGQVCMIWGTYSHPAAVTGEAICEHHNAYPAISAELRALRAAMEQIREKSAPLGTDRGDAAIYRIAKEARHDK